MAAKVSYHDLVNARDERHALVPLDPHSQFMDPDDFKDMQDDTRSRFNGLGVEVARAKTGFSPSSLRWKKRPRRKPGILAGDQILKINGASTEKARSAGCGRCPARRVRTEESR